MFEYAPDLLTRQEAQELLQVGKNTILKFISDGYLPAMIIANSYRIRKSDLIDFIEKSSATFRWSLFTIYFIGFYIFSIDLLIDLFFTKTPNILLKTRKTFLNPFFTLPSQNYHWKYKMPGNSHLQLISGH